MIRKIRDLLKPKPKRPQTGVQLPWNLSREQLQDLHALTMDPRWTSFQSLLDTIATFYAEDLLLRRTDEDVHFLRGFVLGLRQPGLLIHELVDDLSREDARATERKQRASEQSAIRESTTHFGSAFYRPGEH